MEIHRFAGGPFDANSYLIVGRTPEGTAYAAVVDPGFLARRLALEAEALGAPVRYVFVTHGHVDHVFGAMAFPGAEVFFPERDRFLATGAWPGEPYEPPHGNRDLVGGEVLRLPDGVRVEVLSTPGHTPGEVSLYLPEEGVLFSGDTLFRGAIGRTDFPGGDGATLMRSLREVLLALPDETRVLSGHGPETTIGRERATNPFLLGPG
jgi:hydroxyacylglutathione hydrolase